MPADRLALHPLAALVALMAAWGFFGGLFGGERAAPALPAPAQEAVQEALAGALGRTALLPETAALYRARRAAPLWDADARDVLLARLDRAPREGLLSANVHGERLARLARALDAAEGALDAETFAPETDPRPALLAELDVLLSDAALRYADALLGRRADPAALYPGTWFPYRHGDGGRNAVRAAIEAGEPLRVAAALDALAPRHAAYRRLAARYAALHDAAAAWVPVPDGAPLRPGEHSIRVPHLRGRLAALGYLGAGADPSGWAARDPYALDDTLAGALARFRQAHGLAPDSTLDAAATDALNADPQELLSLLALNLERWRWQPPAYEDDFLFVNLPAFELRVFARDGDGPDGPRYAEQLRMPANIGNAATRGWTTPVIKDSVTTIVFQPEWYVPASLAASVVFPMARRDSLALHRAGFEVWHNGARVDSRLVPWDSVSVGEFRFMQRPGPANPLGRVKFMMTNPYAILIHDTNKPWTMADGQGGSLSSGCVQAGDPDGLAAYLLQNRNGWDPERARAAYRRGPRLGVDLERPFPTHFVYFTAWVDEDGSLRTYRDVYGYDARLARALALRGFREPGAAPARDGAVPETMRAG